MEILFLGTGTSHGVPMIACDCDTCRSDNPKNKRLRTSVLISAAGKNILIDTSIDLRQQALRYKLSHIDAVLFTHHHVDHIFGLDETRSFNRIQKTRLPCYGGAFTIEQIKKTFGYVFEYPDIPGGIPMIELIPVSADFSAAGIDVKPITIMHGNNPIFAFRIDKFVYATDCSAIPEASWPAFEDTDVLVLDCLRFRPHPTHFNFDQALEAAKKIGARKTYFTHISHDFEHDAVSKLLPSGVALAYDGLTINC